MEKNSTLRFAAATTLGSKCAIDMVDACPLNRRDESGSWLTVVADPLPGDWEALASKLLDPTEAEREAFRVSYREQLETLIAESGREEDDDEDDEHGSWMVRVDGVDEDLDADNLEEARELAEEWVRGGDWGDGSKSVFVRAHIFDPSGDCVDTLTVEIEPSVPDCEGHDEHDWRPGPGGCGENPGVWGHGGGVVIVEICAHCGLKRTTDTWAQNMATGEQGLVSVTYGDGDDDDDDE